MLHKIRTHHNHPDGRMFSWMVLIFGLSIGMVAAVLPNFVKSLVSTDENVSLFYSFMAIMLFVASLLSTIIFKRVDRATIAKWGFFIATIVLFLFIFVTQIGELVFLQTIRTWFLLFLFIALSLFVRDFSKSKDLGKEEGIFYKFNNIGLFIGPLLGGFLGSRFNYESVFIFAGFVLLFGLFYFYHKHIIQGHKALIVEKRTHLPHFFRNVKKFFKNIGRAKAYLITTFLYFWIELKTIYVPLYVVSHGYLESVTGIILALSIIPFILLEVKVGEYADKKGIKLPLTVGFFLIGLMLIGVFLSTNIIFNFLFLILANVGAAFVEPLQEYTLFKHLPKKDEDELYGIYMTADPIVYFLVPTFGAIILAFFSFEYLFLFFGGLMFLGSGIFALFEKGKNGE